MNSSILGLVVFLAACGAGSQPSPLAEEGTQVVPEIAAAQEEVEGYVAVVTSQRSQIVSAMSSGRVQSLPMMVGDHVAKGQTVIELDLEELKSQLQGARAAQRAAEAAQMKASIEVSEAQRQVALNQRLFRDRVRSREAVRQASFALQRARAGFRESQGVAKEHEAGIALLESKLEQTSLRAEFSGVVSSIEVQSGDSVQPGQRLLRIIEPSDLAVRFAVPAADLSSLRKGQELELEVGAERVKLVLSSISPDIDPALKLGFALASARDPAALRGLAPGSAGRIRVAARL